MKRIAAWLLLSLGLLLMTGILVIEPADSRAAAEKKGPTVRPVENIQVDVLVIGAGAAGLAAGAAAKGVLKDSGRVLILEKKSTTGGNAAWNLNSPITVPGASSNTTPGGMGVGGFATPPDGSKDPQAIADYTYEKIINWNHWRMDAPLVRRLILASQNTTDWLWGLLSDKEKEKLLSQSRQGQERYHIAMTRLCEDLGVEILTDTRATKLLTDKSGAVVGVLAQGKDKDLNISAGGVVIATGGFIGNAELMKKYYLPSDDKLYDQIYIKGEKHTGDGILMAAEVGAALDGSVSFETTFEPIPWEVSDVDVLRSFINRSGGKLIWLNGKGRRFARESENNALNSRQGLFQKIYYTVFDDNIKQNIINQKQTSGAGAPPGAGAPAGTGAPAGAPGMGPGGAQSYDSLDDQIQKQIDKGYAVKANTLDELAKWIGCDPGVLKATITEYNKDCEKGYDSLLLKSAALLVPMNKPPYYAIRNKLAIHLTHGPLRVSTELEVLNTNHNPIPGLYAAGADIGGTENDTYADVSRHSSTWATTGGHIAGENAAEYSRSKKK